MTTCQADAEISPRLVCIPKRIVASRPGPIPVLRDYDSTYFYIILIIQKVQEWESDPRYHEQVTAQLGLKVRFIRCKLYQTTKRVTDDFQERWCFNTWLATIMEFVNELYGMEEESSRGDFPPSVLANVQRTVVLLLAPLRLKSNLLEMSVGWLIASSGGLSQGLKAKSQGLLLGASGEQLQFLLYTPHRINDNHSWKPNPLSSLTLARSTRN